MDESISLKVKFAGVTSGPAADGIPLKPLVAQETQNKYFAFAVPIKKRGGALGRPYAGVGVPALAGQLPETATVVVSDGKRNHEVTLVLKETRSNGGTGKPQRRHDGAVELPVLGRKHVTVYATDLGEGQWNIDAIVRGISGGGGRKAATEDSIKALF